MFHSSHCRISLLCIIFIAENMNNYNRDENNPYCYFHPKERVVGICALCLKERLLCLVLKQGYAPISRLNSSNRAFRVLKRRTSITLPKVFSLSSFLHRLEPLRRNHDKEDQISDKESIVSLEDSFISIKFEDNGEPSWECKKKKDAAAVSTLNIGKTIIEHVKPKGGLRWRKRIGQLLQTARWKRTNKAGAGHPAIVSSDTGSKGWIRSLTRRRSTKK